MPSSEDRNFTVGETIVSDIQVSRPGTKTPVDPASVALTVLRLGSVDQALPAVTAYTKTGTGSYQLLIPSAGMTPGAYIVKVTVDAPVVAGQPQGVVIITDSFVLEPL